MPKDTICKTVRQYNKTPIHIEDMKKLQEIAEDYRKVKNYVYARFGGIGGLSKIYPGYTVQNEMTGSGLRISMGMPSVYFYLAVFDALGDIKSQWTRTKSKVINLVGRNENFTPEDKHYLRFLLKIHNAFEQVLNGKPIELKKDIQRQYDLLSVNVDTDRLHHYLCRQVRKYHAVQHTDKADGFSIAERAYRYADHGIYISIKEKRKRIFIPLTDNNQYKSQLYVKLYPEQGNVEIKVPVHMAVRSHEDYVKQVGISVGIYTMLTTDEGHCYGEQLGRYQIEYADWIRTQTKSYNRNREQNPGRKKYHAQKNRFEEKLHSYINCELNRFFRTEKPRTIYLVKLPRPQVKGANKVINNTVAQWQRGYIRKRLTQKCKEQSIEIIEVLGKGISKECISCGAEGEKSNGRFFCPICGYEAQEKTNTARNVKKRGQGDGVLY
ncbi:hypothetical protein C808_00836 [Lachnospiraceae bacterium M18-1]|nr:hypothetical protein C808_00836 [Lachnospiraceae bacterium M18-1]